MLTSCTPRCDLSVEKMVVKKRSCLPVSVLACCFSVIFLGALLMAALKQIGSSLITLEAKILWKIYWRLCYLDSMKAFFISEMMQPSCREMSILIISRTAIPVEMTSCGLEAARRFFKSNVQQRYFNQLPNRQVHYFQCRPDRYSNIRGLKHSMWFVHATSSSSIWKKRLCSCVLTFIKNKTGQINRTSNRSERRKPVWDSPSYWDILSSCWVNRQFDCVGTVGLGFLSLTVTKRFEVALCDWVCGWVCISLSQMRTGGPLGAVRGTREPQS